MKKGLWISLFIILGSFSAPPKLVKTNITDGITVLVPRDFREMDGIDFTQRFPSVRKPLGAYTNSDRDVGFSVNISATQWANGDTEIARQFFRAGVLNMFDGVDMIDEGINEIHRNEFIYFEFESRIKGEKFKLETRDPVLNYTYIQYLIEPGRTLVFSFSCPRRLRADWQETAGKMMKSIKVK